MPGVSNLTATRRTLRALRVAERVGDAEAGLAQLALTTAGALDEVVAGGEKRYVVAQLARAHLLTLQALLAVPGPEPEDGWDLLLQAAAGRSVRPE
jgi:hypothetical protein